MSSLDAALIGILVGLAILAIEPDRPVWRNFLTSFPITLAIIIAAYAR